MQTNFELVFYETREGIKPVGQFIRNLNMKMRAKVVRSLKLLERNGTKLREPNSKALQDGIYELRVKFGSDITRVLYFFFWGNRIVVTNGFMKKSNKTPPNEIELAKKYRGDFIAREMKKDDDIKRIH